MGRSGRGVAIALAIVAFTSGAGCSPARPIEPASGDPWNVDTPSVVDDQSRLALSAVILDAKQSHVLLHVSAVERDVLPLIFTVTNGGAAPFPVQQEDFRLRLDDGRRIVPALPGRAASLLRDDRASTGAMWAGYLVFGILAAPALHDAERREEAAMRASRQQIFVRAEVPPGSPLNGYLVFEVPVPVDTLNDPVLEMRQPLGAPLEIHLGNPYGTTH
jgi:hypothetical protein